MTRSDTKRDSGKESGKGSGKQSGNSGGSKTSSKGKEKSVPATGPKFIDFASVSSSLDAKLLSTKPEGSRRQSTATGLSVSQKNTIGPQSAFSARSQAERCDTRSPSPWYDTNSKVLSSLSSSFTSNMSEGTEYGQSSGTQFADLYDDAAIGLRVHPKEDFSPGKIVKVEYLDDESGGLQRTGPPMSRQQFIEMDNARKPKIGCFAIFRTYDDYSMGIPIHTSDSKDPKKGKRIPEHQATIYTGPRKLLVDKSLTNKDIQVQSDGQDDLPIGSRLDYSDTFVIEHNVRVAFVGRITSSCFPAFAETYQRVQEMLGRPDIRRPTLQPESTVSTARGSEEVSAGNTYGPQSVYTYRPPAAEEYSFAATSPREYQPLDFVSPPPFGGPSSPDSYTSERTTTSSARRASVEPIPAGDGGWRGGWDDIASEGPHVQLRLDALTLTESRAETIKQAAFSPRSSGYSLGQAYGGMGGAGGGDGGGGMPQMVEAYANPADSNPVLLSFRWMREVIEQRREMMERIVPHGQVEALVNLRNVPADDYAASRVRVAVIDTEVDLGSDVFAPFRDRIKDYLDLRRDGMKAAPNSHGTHVTSLLHHMAPEADIYVAQAFDTWQSVTDAIYHAMEVWKVDIISISGGGRVQYHHDLAQALRQAHYLQIHVFAATHNNGFNGHVTYPARAHTVKAVFSTTYYGQASAFAAAADPLPHKSYGTLGEAIPPFWMREHPTLQSAIEGSSFATPIVVGILASTMLIARLIFNGERYDPYPALLKSIEVIDGLMDMVSKPVGNYRYVHPCDLWRSRSIAAKIRQMVKEVNDPDS